MEATLGDSAKSAAKQDAQGAQGALRAGSKKRKRQRQREGEDEPGSVEQGQGRVDGAGSAQAPSGAGSEQTTKSQDGPPLTPAQKKKAKLAKLKEKQRRKKEAASDPSKLAFKAQEDDHCETPLLAYQDLSGVLSAIQQVNGKKKADIRIYDPYYCNGGVIRKLGTLGYTNVYNKNEDFYETIEKGNVPDFDILVTNPPYSGNHIEKLIKFATSCGKPWFLLLPHYVYTKPYCSPSEYLVRYRTRYAYEPPSWVKASSGSTAVAKGKPTTAPFPSFWYCNFGSRRKAIVGRIQRGASGIYVVEQRNTEMLQKELLLCTSADTLPHEVRGEFDTTRKRPNARSRKRMRAKLAQKA